MIGIDQPIRPPDAGRPHIAFSQPGDTDRTEPIEIWCALNLVAGIGPQLQAAGIAAIHRAVKQCLRITARISGKTFDTVPVAHQYSAEIQIKEMGQFWKRSQT